MADEKQDNDFVEDEAPWRPAEADVDLDVPDDAATAGAEGEAADPVVFKKIVEGVSQTAEGTGAAGPDRLREQEGQAPASNLEAEPADQPDMEITTVSVIEAVLFCSDEPVAPKKMVEILGTGTVKEVRSAVDELNQKYERMNCAFRIEAIAGGYQMLTLPAFNTWLRQLLKVRSETKLSPAALETLAIVAYKQPIIRVEIEAIRGVAVGEMLRQLSEKGLVKIVGRAEELGRPLLYGTTKKFLEIFGLNSLKDLPTVEDLKNPD